MRLTTDQVAHVTKLARIHVKADELAALGDELSGILANAPEKAHNMFAVPKVVE